ncbi:hypothetical protein ACQP2K_17015 [Microbispora siamensis]
MGNLNASRRRLALAATLAGAAVLALLPADGAFAGPSCSSLGCSTTVNDSPMEAWAYFNWCTSAPGTGTWTDVEPTCSSGGKAQATYYLAPGGRTPSNQDWDAFRVDAGWCYRVKFVRDFNTDFTLTFDRRGKSAVWVKVQDNAVAHILNQTNSSAC